MKIWIDICSPPHVHLSKLLADKLESKGHEVVITTRNFYNLKSLLDEKNMDYKVVGKHAGRDKVGKFFTGLDRIRKLKSLVERENIDVFIGKHSTEGPVVSSLKDFESISLVDHDPAPQNLFILPLSNTVVTPRIFSKGWLIRSHKKFDGVFEYSYCKNFKPEKKVLEELGLSKKSKTIVTRTEPFLSGHSSLNGVMYSLLKDIKYKRDVDIVFLPRNREEKKKYSEFCIVPDKPVDVLSLYSFSDLTLSAGSTMNREACLCGCPTVSVCRDKLPSSDKILLERGLMYHNTNNPLNKTIEVLDNSEKEKGKLRKNSKKLEDPMDKILKVLKGIGPGNKN